MRRGSIWLLVILLVGLVACGQTSAPEPVETPTEVTMEEEQTETVELMPVQLRLDWIPGAEHAAYYVAKDLGYYEEVGLDVTINEGSGSSDSARLLGTGEIEFGIVDGAALVSARSQEIPIVSVAAIYQDTPISLAWLADRTTIETPEDLVGHSIGANPSSTHYIGMEAFLEAQDLTDRVEVTTIGFVGMEPLLNGQVDAQMGFVTSDPPLLTAEGHDVGFFLVKDYGVQMYGLTIATNEAFLSENPELVQGFVRASLRGFEFMIEDPLEAMEIERKYVSELDPPELGMERLDLTFPLIQTSETAEHGLGWQTEQKWAATQDTLLEHGVIESATDVEMMFSNIAFE